jgi:SEC-C motif-containing protein
VSDRDRQTIHGAEPHACPCGGAAPGKSSVAQAPRFADCCGRFLAGAQAAPTALELMRSRYSAYVLGDAAYLRATWDPATCPADLDVDPAAAGAPRWLGLQIKRFDALDETHAIVEFVARYKVGGRAERLHEVSRFVRGADARWRYVDGDVSER